MKTHALIGLAGGRWLAGTVAFTLCCGAVAAIDKGEDANTINLRVPAGESTNGIPVLAWHVSRSSSDSRTGSYVYELKRDGDKPVTIYADTMLGGFFLGCNRTWLAWFQGSTLCALDLRAKSNESIEMRVSKIIAGGKNVRGVDVAIPLSRYEGYSRLYGTRTDYCDMRIDDMKCVEGRLHGVYGKTVGREDVKIEKSGDKWTVKVGEKTLEEKNPETVIHMRKVDGK